MRESNQLRRKGGVTLELELTYPATDAPHISKLSSLTLLLAQQLREFGIAIKPVPVSGPDLLARLKNHTFALAIHMGTWNSDPVVAVEEFATGGTFNFSNYANAQVSELLRRANATLEPTPRLEVFKQADKLLATDPPRIPLVQFQRLLVADERLRNLALRGDRAGPLASARDWGFVRA